MLNLILEIQNTEIREKLLDLYNKYFVCGPIWEARQIINGNVREVSGNDERILKSIGF
jgi:hypothetical protein